MFISRITIKNFRLFTAEETFTIDNFNVPNKMDEGSGLNVFVGENGCGKTSLLEALALPILEFKSDNFSLTDMNDPNKAVDIQVFSDQNFEVAKTMPKGNFFAKGFKFKANQRTKDSKSYLSSMIVADQLFIKSDPSNPKDGSPDLRLSVNNPFLGKRFNENDIVFLDKNRLYQTRSGNFNATRFDRLMEDFSHQYIKNSDSIPNINEALDEKIKRDKVKNEFLGLAIEKFKEISGIRVHLDVIDNYNPFRNACFAENKDNNQQIPLSNFGSGYEMIFALLYSYYMAKQSGKQLIVLIDEPELHLHPALQEQFVKFIIEISKETQVFLTTHSSLLIKQLAFNEKAKILILKNGPVVSTLDDRKLSYISCNETNYLAFNLATEEYHNELYEELKYLNGENKSLKDFDNDFFIQEKGELRDSPWKGNLNQVSIHTFIRNQIHHQKDNGKTDYVTLKESISKMRTFL